jgi:hypothetical protein
MDKGHHPKVVRTWTVERIKALPGPAEKPNERLKGNRADGARDRPVRWLSIRSKLVVAAWPFHSMKCPRCKLENPENALRCDCGHEFAAAFAGGSSARFAPTAMTDPSVSLHLRSIDGSLRTIKFVVVAWAVLTAIGFICWFFGVAARH